MKTQTFLLWSTRQRIWMLAAIALVAAYSGSAIAADRIEGSVNGSGGPIGGAMVTLWAAGEAAPRKRPRRRPGPTVISICLCGATTGMRFCTTARWYFSEWRSPCEPRASPEN